MVYREALTLQSNDKMCTFHDITEDVRRIVGRSEIKEGIVSVYSHHTTCSIVIQEDAFDMSMTGLQTMQQDFVDIFDAIVPVCKREGMYLHPQKKRSRLPLNTAKMHAAVIIRMRTFVRHS